MGGAGAGGTAGAGVRVLPGGGALPRGPGARGRGRVPGLSRAPGARRRRRRVRVRAVRQVPGRGAGVHGCGGALAPRGAVGQRAGQHARSCARTDAAQRTGQTGRAGAA
ncbi:MAG: hypothetical protein F4Z07_08155 [Dehalococcoidia bacterium]|nr:hypothetical protein [Dehalococcoidia bacterium]